MKIRLEPGKYVVAVSGGVDSVGLLHILRGEPGVDLVVAHFDHGIRPDSAEDLAFVKALAAQYELPFEYAEGRLGPRASEAAARKARYEFLNRVKSEQGARAIITAHHQDDLLETAVINLLRGTGRKGLNSLNDKPGLRRPLLDTSKRDILKYADEHQLQWREDSTNSDEAYLRNYVRHRLLPRLTDDGRKQLLKILKKSAVTNAQLDTLLVKYLPATDEKTLDRQQLVAAPHEVALEIMAAWLRAAGIRDFDSKTLNRLVVGAKTARSGSQLDVLRSVNLRIGKDDLALVGRER